MKWRKRIRAEAEHHLSDAKEKEQRANEQLDYAHDIAKRQEHVRELSNKTIRENHFTDLFREILNGH